MDINDRDFFLDEKNYIKEETIKKQIVIGHTGNNNMSHFVKWTTRLNGKYNKTAPYTINSDGIVYQHYDPIYTSKMLGNIDLDNKSIIILLENDGWLIKDEEKNKFFNWVGNIYNKPDLVVEKRWRGYLHWAQYTKKQLQSTVELAKKLCDDFYIPNIAIPHNTKVENFGDFMGVIYRSNLEKHYTDLSPAWNFEEFKYKLEKKD